MPRGPANTTYPDRDQCFAHRFCRLLTKAAVAQEIGPEACWLLSVIVHQEDAIRYQRGVTFYNEQLMPLCGFGGKSRLANVRRKAVQAGWLHYAEGTKSKPGTYWVTIPEGYEDTTDTHCDESTHRECRPESGRQTENAVPNWDGMQDVPSQFGTATGRQPDGKPSTINPSPSPTPEKREPASAGARSLPSEELLDRLISVWNGLPDGTGPKVQAPRSEAICKGWRAVQRCPEVRGLFIEAAAIAAEIRGSPFLHGQGWFRLPWLLSRGKTGEWNIAKLMDGAYRKNGHEKPKHAASESPARVRRRGREYWDSIPVEGG